MLVPLTDVLEVQVVFVDLERLVAQNLLRLLAEMSYDCGL